MENILVVGKNPRDRSLAVRKLLAPHTHTHKITVFFNHNDLEHPHDDVYDFVLPQNTLAFFDPKYIANIIDTKPHQPPQFIVFDFSGWHTATINLYKSNELMQLVAAQRFIGVGCVFVAPTEKSVPPYIRVNCARTIDCNEPV